MRPNKERFTSSKKPRKKPILKESLSSKPRRRRLTLNFRKVSNRKKSKLKCKYLIKTS